MTPPEYPGEFDIPPTAAPAGSNPPSQSAVSPASTSSQQVVGGDCVLTGWSFTSSDGNAATLQIIDGDSDNGRVAAEIAITAGSSVTQSTGSGGVEITAGIWVKRLSGSPRGVVYFRPNLY